MLFEFRYGPEDHFSRLDSSRIIPTIESPEWRNWQTRWTQNPVLARECGFDSLLRHPQYNQRFLNEHIIHCRFPPRNNAITCPPARARQINPGRPLGCEFPRRTILLAPALMPSISPLARKYCHAVRPGERRGGTERTGRREIGPARRT